MIVVDLVLLALGAVALVAAGYLAALALWARPAPIPEGRTLHRFDVVVPAHDEEAVLGATLESLAALDYPEHLRRIVVVADNCSDRTAEIAMARGADVLVRDDAERRGKGYALALALERSEADGFADAVVVVDADTFVSANLLRAFSARIAAGARVLQADYVVGNGPDTWRTRLMALAFVLFHGVRSLGRARLGLSAGLRGNGMAFTREALRACPYHAHSLAEDVEYGVELALAGVPVRFVPEARVSSDMPTDGRAARSQRSRWEKGRLELARRYLGPLLRRARQERSPMLLDLAADLLIPPLADLGLAVVLGGAASTAVAWLTPAPWWIVTPWALSFLALCVYLGRGIALSKMGWQALAALAAAPAYLLWKLALGRARWSRRSRDWVRTARKGEAR